MNSASLTRYWAFQLAGWGGFAAINTFFAYSFDKLDSPQNIQVFFGRLSVFVLLGLVSTHFMRFVVIRSNTLLKPFDKQVLEFLLITLCFSLVVSFFNARLLSTYGWLSKNEADIKAKSFLLLVLSGAFNIFIYFFIWNLIYFIYHYVTKSRKQQLDTLQLEGMVKELELKTIKAHINPHFIFNALNSIKALIDENPHRAKKAILELSNILRSSLKDEKNETVAFQEELRIVKDYLALEHMRFEDRLQISYEVVEDTLEQQVPPMMLQTLVENAIKHGISKQVKGGMVKVISDFSGGYHLLSVQNTGHLSGHIKKIGFGISSTRERLQLLFGEKANFQLHQLNDTLVEAKVLIPVSPNI